jgi:hypothetical protein
VHHPVAGAARRHAGELEEGEVGPRAALLVGVEEVIDARVVLIDRLLDHPQAQDARVEVDVPGRVGGDARYVVDAFELHEDEGSVANILSLILTHIHLTRVGQHSRCGYDDGG